MRFSLKHTLVAVFLVGSLVFLGVSCSKNSPDSASVAISSVSIENLAFAPAIVSVSSGTVVTWKNEDLVQHQIQSDGDLPDLISGILAPNDTFSFTFNQAGTWKYHCSLHPNMKGEIIVK